MNMKPQILFILLMALTMSNFAQNNPTKSIPQEVKANFQKQYPMVEEARWEKEGENYEVEFKQGNKDISVRYDAKGNLIETETEIKAEDLPKGVKKYLSENFDGQKIKEASVITKADGTLLYEAEIKGKDLIFNSEGIFIKEQKK